MTNQHGPKPMRRYAVFLDDATAEYYKRQGGNNRSEGMREVARQGMEREARAVEAVKPQ